MDVRHDRIARVQASMREEGLVAIVVMTHDDFRYLFGTERSQPRAVIPAEGPPELIAFAAEEPELRASLENGEVRVFTSVGGQIHDVVSRLHEIVAGSGIEPGVRPRVGMQLWFDTPAFLVDMFRKVNPGLEVVSSDPVMDPLRAVKDADELALMTEAQRIAGLGMDRAREMLREGVTAHELATESLYVMMRAGAEKTSTPVWVNVGIETCMLHGRQSPKPIDRGDLVIVDLTPQVEGYCANLARTFVLGQPDDRQRQLIDAYLDAVDAARAAMRPGATMAEPRCSGRRGLRPPWPRGVPRPWHRPRTRAALRGDSRTHHHPSAQERAPARGHDRHHRASSAGHPRLRRCPLRGRLPRDRVRGRAPVALSRRAGHRSRVESERRECDGIEIAHATDRRRRRGGHTVASIIVAAALLGVAAPASADDVSRLEGAWTCEEDGLAVRAWSSSRARSSATAASGAPTRWWVTPS